jgi:AAA domain
MDEQQAHSERVLLGNLLNGMSERVWASGVTPLMFEPGPRQQIAALAHDMFINGDKVTIPEMQGRLASSPGTVPAIGELMACSESFWPGGSTEVFSKILRDNAARRSMRQSLSRSLQMLDTDAEPEQIMETLTEMLAATPSQQQMGTVSLDEVLAMEAEPYTWVIPGMLARRDRLMLTGNEGSGKSFLMAQLAMGAAFGVHPFDLGSPTFEPQRVLVLDVENDHQHQLSRTWHTMATAFRMLRKHAPVEPDIRLVDSKDIDLFNATEAAEFIRTCVSVMPNLVVMGSLYKLTASSDEHEKFARTVQSVIDKVRARTGAAVIIEAHAGHGFQGNRNNGRPDGSSLWLRWPELGWWLKPIPAGRDYRLHTLHRWRGDRTTRDKVPTAIRMGGGARAVLPWVGIDAEEWAMSYSHMDT